MSLVTLIPAFHRQAEVNQLSQHRCRKYLYKALLAMQIL